MPACKVDNVVGSPFIEVDAVKDEIFQKVVSFPNPDSPDNPAKDQTDISDSGNRKITGFLSHAIPRVSHFGYFQTGDDPDPPDQQDPAREETAGACTADETPRNDPAREQGGTRAAGAPTSYATLPDDVNILETPAAEFDEEATMKAIRTIMVAQKREFSRLILPDLIEADSPGAPGADSADDNDHAAISARQSRLTGAIRLFKSPMLWGAVRWLVLCVAISVINHDYFLVFASVSAASLAVISLLYVMVLLWTRLTATIAGFFKQMLQTVLPGKCGTTQQAAIDA